MKKQILLYADADSVRLRVESLLLASRLAELAEFSRLLEASIQEAAAAFASRFSGDIIVAGGDDILVELEEERYSRTGVNEIASKFESRSGLGLSVGVGNCPEQAYLNLRRSKVAGGSSGTDFDGTWAVNG